MATKHLSLLCRLLHPTLSCTVHSELLGGDAVFDQQCAAVLFSQGEKVKRFSLIINYFLIEMFQVCWVWTGFGRDTLRVFFDNLKITKYVTESNTTPQLSHPYRITCPFIRAEFSQILRIWFSFDNVTKKIIEMSREKKKNLIREHKVSHSAPWTLTWFDFDGQ